MSENRSQLPIVVVGAGLVGLTLAQAFKKNNIPFKIYERDSSLEQSGGGWAITIHWALPIFERCLPDVILNQLESIQVDPQYAKHDAGKFLFLDLSTAKPKYEIPPSKRLRLNRPRMRKLLAEGIDINWNKPFSDFEVAHKKDAVTVKFEDGSETKGSLLIGVDGGTSRVRRCLINDEMARSIPLDVKLMGVTARMNETQIAPLRQIDPLLFQGCHPDTGIYLWYSLVSTPESNGSTGTDAYYEGQLLLSWRHKSPADDVPSTNSERLSMMKRLAEPFEHRLRKAIQDLPGDVEVLEIKLSDWPPNTKWDNLDGRVTLVGDAAHSMTMFRGQGVNHGIADVDFLIRQLLAMRDGSSLTRAQLIEKYETEMRLRTHDAVLLSRQACLDAHDLHGLTSDSPLVSKRTQLQSKS